MKGRDLLMEWTLQEAFVALAERLPELERQVNQTSQNSHQPPV